MVVSADSKFGQTQFWYRVFKYTIYCFLAYNIWLFFLQDSGASAQTFTDGITWRNLVEAYSATFDTLAWVILLLIFELQTAIIPDEKLQGSLKWVLVGFQSACYFFIAYSFYGYIVKYGVVTNVVPLGAVNACDLLGSGYTFPDSLDEYFPLTPEICASMQGEALHRIAETSIIGTSEQMLLLKRLALTDVINAGDWLIVVAILEIEVLLQLKGLLSDRLLTINKIVKGLLYLVLFGCAIYWGIDGEFLDFWDAFLWLVAFIFIELNIFEWQAETSA